MEYMVSTEDRVMPSHEFRRLIRKALVRAMERRSINSSALLDYIDSTDDVGVLEQLLVTVMEGRAPSIAER